MASDDPTSAEQEAAISTVVANGWADESEIRSWVANESGPRTSVRRILTAFTPNPGAEAVRSGRAVDPGMITTVDLARGYAAYQAQNKIDVSGYYATPTPITQQNEAVGTVPGDSKIRGKYDPDAVWGRPGGGYQGGEIITGTMPPGWQSNYPVPTPEPPIATPQNRPASGAAVPTIINAPGIPTWAIVLGAGLLAMMMFRRG